MNSSHYGHASDGSPTAKTSPSFLSAYFSGLITNDIQYTLRVLIDTFIKMSICVLGLGTNIINIIVFIQIGLKDSITISFLGLAFADLGFVFFTFSYQLFENLDIISGLKPEVDYRSLSFVLNVYAFYFVDMSVLITVFTSLQKCACVAIPFLFKNIFTRTLSSCVLSIMYSAMLVYYLPAFIFIGLKQKFDPQLNRTRFVLSLSDVQQEVLNKEQIFNRMTIPISSIILVTLSMAIMTVKLVEASKVRHGMTKKQGDPSTSGRQDSRNNQLSPSQLKDTSTSGRPDTSNNQLSPNELKAMQAVFVVSAIFVTCNLPDMVSFLVSHLTPDFSDHGSYIYSFRLTRAVQNVLVVTNAAVNILVYFKYNSKYRRQLKADVRNLV